MSITFSEDQYTSIQPALKMIRAKYGEQYQVESDAEALALLCYMYHH